MQGGALIDFVEFVFVSGEPLVVGEGNGEEQEPFDLEPGEAGTGSRCSKNCPYSDLLFR